ncbi:YjhX family toxin [Paracoccus sp. PAR01]|uniref:YjhX family toxin n=1 Tax=Paracoccus sp. PAR01 TaxID=2769282 RepID=UPI001786CEAC|nr:YjhX family toxin [Paracoccus sp. PAR01]MBD9528561.1 YjhX family toxin [Paracoccus sp. PAR01]
MNISKNEQRVLHVLAQGGQISYARGPNGRLIHAECVTHDGALLVGCTLDIVAKLRRKRLIESRNSNPYRISAMGRLSVRAQADNRVR